MKLDKPVDVPKSACPNCQVEMDAASRVSGSGEDFSPHEGDLTVCISCGVWLKFGANMVLRYMTPLELVEIDAHTRAILSRVKQAVDMMECKKE